MEHKAGFVNIIGNPNVGKSTLMNTMLGEKLSIVTPKNQTTRHRIMGIASTPEYQIVFSDTPGILKPHYKLQESMMKTIGVALTDADIILYITDVVETWDKNNHTIERLKKSEVPVLVLLNKIDLSNQEKVVELITHWQGVLPAAEVYPISALLGANVELVRERILSLLPVHPPYFPPDEITDRSERFFVSEIIREKIFFNYKEEIPYSTQVEIESFKEEKGITRISAVIYVMRDSQKGILIGKKGDLLKKTATAARKEMEHFLGRKVFLEIFVKVNENWRDNPQSLQKFGYES
jgi:GTP-binding protein Era